MGSQAGPVSIPVVPRNATNGSQGPSLHTIISNDAQAIAGQLYLKVSGDLLMRAFRTGGSVAEAVLAPDALEDVVKNFKRLHDRLENGDLVSPNNDNCFTLHLTVFEVCSGIGRGKLGVLCFKQCGHLAATQFTARVRGVAKREDDDHESR